MLHTKELAVYLTAVLAIVNRGKGTPEEILDSPSLTRTEAHFLRAIDAALDEPDPVAAIKKAF